MELPIYSGYITALVFLLACVQGLQGEPWQPVNDQYQLSFNPPNLDDILAEQTHTIWVTSCFNMTSLPVGADVIIQVSLGETVSTECSFPAKTVPLASASSGEMSEYPNCTKWSLGVGLQGNLSLSCSHFGHAKLQIQLCVQNLSYTDCDSTAAGYEVSVIRQHEVIDTVCYVLLVIFVVIVNFLFGCSVELEAVKETLKHPLAPIIGMVFQLALLCPIAYAYTYILSLPASIACGLVAHAASPGAGQSNTYTLLLGGDLTLSICMSLCSTILSLGTASLWLLTLAQTLLPASVSIPVTQILLSFSLLLFPLAAGLLLRHFKPKAGQQAARARLPVAILFAIMLLTVGIYTYRYIFTVLFSDWRTVVVALAFPYTIMLLAGLVAGLCRETWPRVLTVVVEVGIQNGGITLIVLSNTLGQPEADLASVAPIACILLTPIPLFIGIIVRLIYQGYKKLKTKGSEGEEREGELMKKRDDLETVPENDCVQPREKGRPRTLKLIS